MKEQVYSMYSDGNNKKELERIQIERIMTKAMQYWPLFSVCILISLCFGFLYIKFATPIYKVNAKILIKDEKQGSGGEGQIFQDLGIKSGVASVDNEVEIIKSRMLMQEVVQRLHLNVLYFDKSSFKDIELYNDNLPFKFTPLFNGYNIQSGHTYKVKREGTNGIINRR